MSNVTSPLAPALNALDALRKEISVRVGKEGGNLNGRVLQYLATIEATLKQIEPLGQMLNIVNQQTQVSVQAFRALSHVAQLTPMPSTGDNGESETKGV